MEAGDEQPMVSVIPGLMGILPNSSIDYAYRLEAKANVCENNPNSCAAPRGKVMGGSSSVNGMGYVRGNKLDYDEWAGMGNPGWSWNEVLPYFKKSEDLSRVSYAWVRIKIAFIKFN